MCVFWVDKELIGSVWCCGQCHWFPLEGRVNMSFPARLCYHSYLASLTDPRMSCQFYWTFVLFLSADLLFVWRWPENQTRCILLCMTSHWQKQRFCNKQEPNLMSVIKIKKNGSVIPYLSVWTHRGWGTVTAGVHLLNQSHGVKSSTDTLVALHFVIHLSVMQSGRPLRAVRDPVQFESKQNGSRAHAAGWGSQGGKTFGSIISPPPLFASFFWVAGQEAERFRGITLSIHLNTLS